MCGLVLVEDRTGGYSKTLKNWRLKSRSLIFVTSHFYFKAETLPFLWICVLSGFLNFGYDKGLKEEEGRTGTERDMRGYFSKENWWRKEEREKLNAKCVIILSSCVPGKAERQVSDGSHNLTCICKVSPCNQDSV